MSLITAAILTLIGTPSQPWHKLDFDGGVGDRYVQFMTFEVGFDGRQEMKIESWIQHRIVEETPTSLTYRVSVLDWRVSGRSEMASSAGFNVDVPGGFTYTEVRRRNGSVLRPARASLLDQVPVKTEIEFPTNAVPLGAKWFESVGRGRYRGSYTYTLNGVDMFEDTPVYRIHARFASSNTSPMRFLPGPANIWQISQRTGMILHASMNLPININGRMGYCEWKIEQLSGPR
ncbi:MAG: hypothetical protein HONBIEJF_00437 [Fimbriimonadaceae bacterium]|nr:hypothetical protein [Fimbriimonadaceae bacterium]